MVATSTLISGPGGDGEKVSLQSQPLPRGHPALPSHRGTPRPQGPAETGDAAFGGKKSSPQDFHLAFILPWGEDRGDHEPTAGGMLPMLLRTATVPECGSSSTLASRVATPSSWVLRTPTRLPRTRRGSSGARGTGALGYSPMGKHGVCLSPLSIMCQENLIFWT